MGRVRRVGKGLVVVALLFGTQGILGSVQEEVQGHRNTGVSKGQIDEGCTSDIEELFCSVATLDTSQVQVCKVRTRTRILWWDRFHCYN